MPFASAYGTSYDFVPGGLSYTGPLPASAFSKIDTTGGGRASVGFSATDNFGGGALAQLRYYMTPNFAAPGTILPVTVHSTGAVEATLTGDPRNFDFTS